MIEWRIKLKCAECGEESENSIFLEQYLPYHVRGGLTININRLSNAGMRFWVPICGDTCLRKRVDRQIMEFLYSRPEGTPEVKV